MHEGTSAEPTSHYKPATRWLRFRRLRWWALLLLIVAVGSLTVFIIYNRSGTPPELVAAQKAVGFPIYYSQQAPIGFIFDKTSVSYTPDVVLYSYLYDNDKHVAVSIQSRMPGFSADQFRPTSDFTTHIGRAYVVDLDDRSSAAVVGDKSWVLINAPDKMPADTLRQLIDSLRQLN